MSQDVQALLLRIEASTELARRELQKLDEPLDGLGQGADDNARRFGTAMEKVTKSAKESAQAFQAAFRQQEKDIVRQGLATRNLGFQFGDFATQVSTGTSVFQAFGQQAGQAAIALQDFGGVAGRIGAFLAGPWGIILTSAITVLGGFATKHFMAAEGAKEQEKAEKQLKDALGALDQVTGAANVSQRERIRLAKEAANAAIEQTRQELTQAKATLARLRADETARRGVSVLPGGGPVPSFTGPGPGVAAAEKEVDRLAKIVADFDTRAAASARFGLADLAARAAIDPIERIRQQTAAKVDAIRALNLSQEESSKRLQAVYTQEAAAIARVSNAAKEARGGNAGSPARAAAAPAPEQFDRLGRLQLEQAIARPVAAGPNILEQAKIDLPPVVADFEKIQAAVADISTKKFISAAAIQASEQIGQNLSRGLAQAIVESRSLKDVLLGTVKAVANEFLASGLLRLLNGGDEGGGGILGKLFGGFFATGGRPPMGRVSVVGERGPELFVPSVPGEVIPNYKLQALAGGGGGQSLAIAVDPSPFFVTTVQRGASMAGRQAATETIRQARRPRMLASPGA